MPKKSYIIYLEDNIFIRVYFLTDKKDVLNYVIKLIFVFENKEYEIIRYDSFHDRAHMDILSTDGQTQRKVWLSNMNNNDALTNAINDIQKNYEIYIERFKKWLEERKQV